MPSIVKNYFHTRFTYVSNVEDEEDNIVIYPAQGSSEGDDHVIPMASSNVFTRTITTLLPPSDVAFSESDEL